MKTSDMIRRSSGTCLLVLFLSLSLYGAAQERAPVRDINGVWNGAAVMDLEPFPEMTEWGQERFDAARPFRGPRAVVVSDSNDGFRMCDPLGFPRSVFYELRGVEFLETSNKMLMMFQYHRTFREIWTDGRELPTNVGTYEQGAPDPAYLGYAVGRWEDDTTFVVNSTGFHEGAWSDPEGHPRSVSARIEERYRRIDQDTLEITVTIDDPVAYTEPFVAMKQVITWDPDQEFEEQFCIPSEALEYISTFAPER